MGRKLSDEIIAARKRARAAVSKKVRDGDRPILQEEKRLLKEAGPCPDGSIRYVEWLGKRGDEPHVRTVDLRLAREEAPHRDHDDEDHGRE